MTVKMSEAFPSRYVKASDLKGKPLELKMSNVEMEDLGQGDLKPVLYFVDRKKGLVLNKTNGNNIAKAYGDSADGWVHKPVVIYPTEVDFRGESVAAIRVRIPTALPPDDDPNDEIDI